MATLNARVGEEKVRKMGASNTPENDKHAIEIVKFGITNDRNRNIDR